MELIFVGYSSANFGETIDTFGKLCAKPQIFEGSLVKFPIDVVVDRSYAYGVFLHCYDGDGDGDGDNSLTFRDTRAVPQLDVVRDEL